MGCHALLQGIFPTEGSNPGLLHCRQILYLLSRQESQSSIVLWQPQSTPLTSTSPASSLGGVSPLQKFSSQYAVPKANSVTLGVPLTQSAVCHCFGGCPGGSDSKEPACKAGDPGSISGLGGSAGEGNVCPLQYSGLENP